MIAAMLRRLRQQPARKWRIVLMTMLVMCLVLQPVLAAVGQVHDVFEQAAQTAPEQGAAAHHERDFAGTKAADAIHVLLHQAHCCTPAAATFAAAPGLSAAGLSAAAPTSTTAVDRVPTRPGHPFRPPIAA